MTPNLAIVHVENPHWRGIRLWIPLFLLWIPVILLSPLIFIACLLCRVNPFRAFGMMWQILSTLTDTKLELEHHAAGMSFHIL